MNNTNELDNNKVFPSEADSLSEAHEQHVLYPLEHFSKTLTSAATESTHHVIFICWSI